MRPDSSLFPAGFISLSQIIGAQNTSGVVSPADPKIRTLLKRCRNNGILEYGNDDIFLKTQYSSIPSFQVSEGISVHKAIIYDNFCPPGKWFLDRCDNK